MNLTYDVLIVGAGVAGSAAAAYLSSRGKSVAIVDKAEFPRAKICGGCLSSQAIATLQRLGLESVFHQVPHLPLDLIEFRRSLALSASLALTRPQLPKPIALSRADLDWTLLNAAIARGADFFPGHRAVESSIDPSRRMVRLRGPGNESLTLAADCVLACDGLASTLASHLRRPAKATRPKIGIGAQIPSASLPPLPRRTITMLCGRSGYAGLVHLADGTINVAAAVALPVDPVPWNSVARIAEESGEPELAQSLLRARPPRLLVCPQLQRRVARPWDDRLLVLGDAAGYVEPITGEGMAWALASAECAAAALEHAWTPQSGPNYERLWRDRVASRRAPVRLAARVLDSEMAASIALRALHAAPAAGQIITGYINRIPRNNLSERPA